MKKLLFGAMLGLVLAAAACAATGATPTSPSATPAATPAATANAQGTASPVGVSGLIRNLDTANRSFTLMLTSSTTTRTRGETRLVRADGNTQLTVKGSSARFAALANGMAASVRGTDEGRFILARSIVAR